MGAGDSNGVKCHDAASWKDPAEENAGRVVVGYRGCSGADNWKRGCPSSPIFGTFDSSGAERFSSELTTTDADGSEEGDDDGVGGPTAQVGGKEQATGNRGTP